MPVANSQRHYLFTHRGINVGIIGIVEKEWLDTIRDLPPWVQVPAPSHGSHVLGFAIFRFSRLPPFLPIFPGRTGD